MSNNNNTIDTTALRQALELIAEAAKKASGCNGSYHISACYRIGACYGREGMLDFNVTHFAPGVTRECTGGSGATPERVIADLVDKIGTPASRAAKLREEAAEKLRAAGEIEAAAVATANA
jgi:hypothetical protein